VEKEFNVSFDTYQMMQGIYIDTTQQLNYEKRIEIQQLGTEKALQAQLKLLQNTLFANCISIL
jgi:multidrug efflux system outer membrane protein